jgi:CheY-like chemotaxis protein
MDQERFDLVLMDIQMPVMNGEEALREIRTKEQNGTRHQAVIALTAYALRGEKQRFIEEGFDGYISKPLVVEELHAELKRVMNTDLST